MNCILSTEVLWGSINLTDNLPSLSHPTAWAKYRRAFFSLCQNGDKISGLQVQWHYSNFPNNGCSGCPPPQVLEGQEPSSSPRGTTLWTCQGPSMVEFWLGLTLITVAVWVSDRLDHILRFTHHCCRGPCTHLNLSGWLRSCFSPGNEVSPFSSTQKQRLRVHSKHKHTFMRPAVLPWPSGEKRDGFIENERAKLSHRFRQGSVQSDSKEGAVLMVCGFLGSWALLHSLGDT